MKTVVRFSLAVVLLACLAVAQDKPSFSGKWVMNSSKSEFGAFPGPDSRTDDIDHKEPKIKVMSATKGQQGERTTERNYTTDGEENTNAGFGGNPMKSKTRWEGKTLVTETKLKFQDNDVEIKDVWELLEEGKVLVIKRDLKSSQGEISQKVHFDKK